jgi:hypothetical protein
MVNQNLSQKSARLSLRSTILMVVRLATKQQQQLWRMTAKSQHIQYIRHKLDFTINKKINVLTPNF